MIAKVLCILPCAFFFTAALDGKSEGCQYSTSEQNLWCRRILGAAFEDNLCDHGCQCASGYCDHRARCSDPTDQSVGSDFHEVGLNSNAPQSLGASNCTQWLDTRYPDGTDAIVTQGDNEAKINEIVKLIITKFMTLALKVLSGATMCGHSHLSPKTRHLI
jgi:hypothetical protein